MLEVEGEYGTEKIDELQRICQFIDLNKDFVLDQFTAYKEKVKETNILLLKLSNHKTTIKHELNLGNFNLDQYNKKIEILNKKLKEQELIKSSINDQFILNVFGSASTIPLPPESIISYLQEVFL